MGYHSNDICVSGLKRLLNFKDNKIYALWQLLSFVTEVTTESCGSDWVLEKIIERSLDKANLIQDLPVIKKFFLLFCSLLQCLRFKLIIYTWAVSSSQKTWHFGRAFFAKFQECLWVKINFINQEFNGISILSIVGRG